MVMTLSRSKWRTLERCNKCGCHSNFVADARIWFLSVLIPVIPFPAFPLRGSTCLMKPLPANEPCEMD